MAITGPTTEIEIVSLAFVLNGKSPIQSYDEAGKAGAAAKALFDATASTILAYPHFRFNVRTIYLQLIANTNINFDQWQYAYQLPADFLSLVRLWPNIPYQIYGQQIWSMSNSTLQMEYRFQVPVSHWSAPMRFYAAYEVASQMALSISESDQLFKELSGQLAEKRAMALFTDSQNHPQRNANNSSWIAVRGRG